MTTQEILNDIASQHHKLRKKNIEPKFVILDKLSYLALDQHLPLPSHISKVYGFDIVVMPTSALYIHVVSDPYTEAIR